MSLLSLPLVQVNNLNFYCFSEWHWNCSSDFYAFSDFSLKCINATIKCCCSQHALIGILYRSKLLL